MSQKVLWSLGAIGCAVAMLFVTSDASQAAGHGGGGHGGGGHAGGFYGGGRYGGGGGWHGGGWGRYGGGWRGRAGYYGGYGYYPWSYGFGDYPYYGYSDYPDYGYSNYAYEPSYSNYAPTYGSTATSGYPIYSAPVASDNEVHVTVRVPADAQVWFENQPTTQQGAVRDFASPPLTPGSAYTYSIRAQWPENGRDINQTRHVVVHAGSHVTVDFTQPASVQQQMPTSAGSAGL